MNIKKLLTGLFAAVAFFVSAGAFAQSPPPYGANINFDQAKKAMAAAEAEAKKNNWGMVITIVDTGGNMVMMGRLDNTQFGSNKVAFEKAHASAAFRRPTFAFQNLIAQGGVHLRLLNITGDAGVLGGAVPVVVDGKIIGAIGVSGGTSEQDEQVALVGANVLK